ncbi:hypothetical protein SERLADRAFT_370151 [Serpula lacrymans var. lacrymans S7.9]|uniref:Protein phosphatase methylesterase 1 n=1 Tax=Serpula lacrymans var. lacrymans (strain S7.9) TaxID=578457 RepID=F8NVZ1_SERL9|nr:uncharacterized protein SERLADRAFT_370151 [Serpula lacrymans var. lacrymans S7.9]EGO24925.1 hypothetical protein SERLADRAFT_370151 [Serpula lacrymans var. lacrymans S7.9]
MSDLYRSAISARIAKLPSLPPSDEDDEQDEATNIIGLLPTGMGPPALRTPNAAFSPISASEFFTEAIQVSVPSANLDIRVYHTPPKLASGTLMVCHHGAGYSGLTFACFAKEVSDMTKGELGILSLDARRHGKTTSTAPDEDLSIDVLTADLLGLLRTLYPDPASAPTFLLLGHSMGGSVVVRTCPMLLELKYKVAGVAVLDVVEGSAVEALPHMHSLLNSRPDGFDSLEEAVEWHVNTNLIRNPNSARVSIPAVFVPSSSDSSLVPAYQWRTPLRSTASYWSSWFTGLSNKFLAAKAARILILAGTDRLDKELMIGQMQGKFQMEVLANVGHMLHEDDPTRLAEILVEFWKRNDRVIIGVKNIKKVGEN